jgi:hypothetical protein
MVFDQKEASTHMDTRISGWYAFKVRGFNVVDKTLVYCQLQDKREFWLIVDHECKTGEYRRGYTQLYTPKLTLEQNKCYVGWLHFKKDFASLDEGHLIFEVPR